MGRALVSNYSKGVLKNPANASMFRIKVLSAYFYKNNLLITISILILI